jgi:hypothetical protein
MLIFCPYALTANQAFVIMVSEGRGRLFRKKDAEYLFCLPKDLAEDSMFPFKVTGSRFVKVSFAYETIKFS